LLKVLQLKKQQLLKQQQIQNQLKLIHKSKQQQMELNLVIKIQAKHIQIHKQNRLLINRIVSKPKQMAKELNLIIKMEHILIHILIQMGMHMEDQLINPILINSTGNIIAKDEMVKITNFDIILFMLNLLIYIILYQFSYNIN
jgi:hypothetical protein